MATALSLASCVQDLEGTKQEKAIDGDGTALVTLSLTVPAPPSRALTVAQEEAISRIDVLLFTSDKLYYRAAGTDITPATGSTKNITVKLPLGDDYN
ncbi:MAG: hypothetical protein LBG30_05910, partial [Odoribacteraceae bacterium]|nr:hypothetical protein [Odoribacteraceae bacterium]